MLGLIVFLVYSGRLLMVFGIIATEVFPEAIL